MKKIIFLAFFVVFTALTPNFAAYLKNVPYQLVQPNGEILNTFITGDEFYQRVHDSEGYSIVLREDGWYCYALYDEINDELIPSDFIVSSSRKEILPMEKELGISYDKYIEKRRIWFEHSNCDISGADKNSLLDN